MTKKERYRQFIEYFSHHEPKPETELRYYTPYQLLVAVILSAQCTDKRVNMITPALFDRFPDAAALADTTADQVYEFIKSCTYPNN
ncbi:MAG: endonuclease III, partial [Bacteroidales bacterium]|nr:endonuclease III [Bacteroidales bacterium]